MTNLEYMIASLKGEFDDDGSSYEATVHYNIGCPYFGDDQRAHCKDDDVYPSREVCVPCKMEWLEREVDE